jgi:hypothetical protein
MGMKEEHERFVNIAAGREGGLKGDPEDKP